MANPKNNHLKVNSAPRPDAKFPNDTIPAPTYASGRAGGGAGNIERREYRRVLFATQENMDEATTMLHEQIGLIRTLRTILIGAENVEFAGSDIGYAQLGPRENGNPAIAVSLLDGSNEICATTGILAAEIQNLVHELT